MIFTWFTVNLLIACFADSIKDVISVAGSIAALFMFFFPGLFSFFIMGFLAHIPSLITGRIYCKHWFYCNVLSHQWHCVIQGFF